VRGSYTHASGYSGALQMLERPEGRPTAIIAGNDTVALGVLEATHRLGLHVPRDVSIIGCDDIPMAESAFIGLTTVRPPIEEMARIVARRVVDRVSDPTGPVHTDILPISLVRRATTGPALSSAAV
jgi:LacI family transcriptional regulator